MYPSIMPRLERCFSNRRRKVARLSPAVALPECESLGGWMGWEGCVWKEWRGWREWKWCVSVGWVERGEGEKKTNE